MKGGVILREYLIKLRKGKSLTQQQMADKIGITKQYYSLIEKGKRQKKMDIVLVSAIASVFDMPIAQIVEYEKELMKS